MKSELVYIIDDDSSVREALTDLLASVDIATQSFENVDAFMKVEKANTVSCLLLDVRMPGQSGIDFHQRMQENDFKIPVVFITGHGDIPMSVSAIKSGAVDFLTKPFREHDILEAIHRALEISREHIKQRELSLRLEKNIQSLNAGEAAVMALLMKGYLNKQIAAELNVSEITIKVRRANVMQKMKANSFADLIRKGIEIEKTPQ